LSDQLIASINVICWCCCSIKWNPFAPFLELSPCVITLLLVAWM
jgi:hypothetical protein